MDPKGRQIKWTTSSGVKTERLKKPEQILYRPPVAKTPARVVFDPSVVDIPLVKMGKDSLTNGTSNHVEETLSSEDMKELEGCFEVFTKLASKKMFSKAKHIVAEHGKLQSTKDVLLETNGSQRDKIKRLAADNEEQREKLDMAKIKVEELESQLTKEREMAEKQLKVLEADSKKMKRLDSLFATTRKLSSMDEITPHLDTIFKSAHELVCKSFGDDLPEFFFNDWENMRENFPKIIPLPASNTQDAKHMRIAAVLSCLADLSCELLFQPVYLSENDNGFRQLLEDADAGKTDNDETANYLRRFLLNMYSEKQAVYAHSRALKVGKTMRRIVADILPPKQLETFTAELDVWSKNTAEAWMEHIQPLEYTVTALKTLGTNTSVYWEAMPPIDKEEAAEDDKEAKMPNGTGKAGKDKSPKNVDIRAPIWPLFLWVEKDQCDIARKGVVLTMAQTKKADEAIKAAEALKESMHRNSRTSQRQNAMLEALLKKK